MWISCPRSPGGPPGGGRALRPCLRSQTEGRAREEGGRGASPAAAAPSCPSGGPVAKAPRTRGSPPASRPRALRFPPPRYRSLLSALHKGRPRRPSAPSPAPPLPRVNHPACGEPHTERSPGREPNPSPSPQTSHSLVSLLSAWHSVGSALLPAPGPEP